MHCYRPTSPIGAYCVGLKVSFHYYPFVRPNYMGNITRITLNIIPVMDVAGVTVLAKFHQDGNWYRARILGINDTHPPTIEVVYSDYGNTETVTLERYYTQCVCRCHIVACISLLCT